AGTTPDRDSTRGVPTTAGRDAALPGGWLGDQPGAVGSSTPPVGAEAGDDGVRRELARELHDQVVQELTATLIDLENFKRQPYDERAVADQVDQVQGSIRRTLRELRHLLYDLRDEEAWQPGFMTSLRDFASRYQQRTGMRVSVSVDGDWPPSIRAAAAKQLQRIIHEAVNNARLHGGARSVWVSLLAEAELARVTMLLDIFNGPVDAAVVISNDSDLSFPIVEGEPVATAGSGQR